MFDMFFKIIDFIEQILLYFRVLIFGILDTLIIFQNQNQKLKSTILVIRLDAIGDFVLWLNAAKEFRTLYPNQRITLLANKAWVELAKELPYWDEVWELDRRQFYSNPLYRAILMNKVRQKSFETVINPIFSREFFYGDALVRVSGATNKIGYSGNYSNLKPWQKKISDRWYTRLIPATAKPLMEICRNAEFMRAIGLASFKADVSGLPIDCEEFVLSKIIPKKFYVLFPGAGATFRQWPSKSFALLSEEIFKKTGLTGLICGGSGEEVIAKDILSISSSPLIDFVGKTSLFDLCCLIARSAFVIGNETSAVHIATAVNTHSVCILGGGHYGRFMPYVLETHTDAKIPVSVIHQMDCFNCDWERPCMKRGGKQKVVPCIDKITVEEVWRETEKIIGIYERGDV